MSGNLFQGTVLKPTRAGSPNSSESSVPVSGVDRDVKPPPLGYDLYYPEVLDIGLQRYKAAILEQEDPSLQYMLWAANSSNLARIDDPTWSLNEGYVKIPTGENVVIDSQSPDTESGTPVRRDGTVYLVVRDNQERSITQILSIKVRNGDTQAEETLSGGVDFQVLDADSGLVEILDTALTHVLNPYGSEAPSASVLRGDTIVEVVYVLAPQLFWWSRNDTQSTRFGWSDKTQSWALWKGSIPVFVGVLTPSRTYTLEPKPTDLTVGNFLPGSLSGDAWCMLRLGPSPDASSIPLAKNPAGPFDGVLIVSDYTSREAYNFGAVSPPPVAVIGETNGLLQWNPSFVQQYAGKQIWYNYRSFQEGSNGVIGDLLTAKDSILFIAPVPRVYERPMIRIGSRKYLDTIIVNTEAELATTVVAQGRVGVALSTGRLKFNAQDVDKSDPYSVLFERSYLNDQVFYDGVALNAVAQPPRPAIILEDSTGSTAITPNNVFYVSDSNSFRGLGRSGIEHVCDTTGASPASGIPSVRPGGDNPGDPYTGLIRQVVGLSEPIVFTKEGPLTSLVVVDRETDLPEFRYKIPDNTVYVTRENVFDVIYRGSRLEISLSERTRLAGLELYYQQPLFTPSLYISKASIYSRVCDFFSLMGTEKLYFALDALNYIWDASALVGTSPFSAEDVAASIDAVITGTGRAYAFSGHIVLEAGDPTSGLVEIGLGSAGVEDLSGCSALGFLPGWQVDSSDPDSYWLSDSGVSFGLSPNITQDAQVADFRLLGRLEDQTLQKKISPSDLVFLDPIPLKDIPGYAQDQFFRLQDGDNLVDLNNYEEVFHQFELGKRFSWLSEHSESQEVSRPTSFFFLGQRNIIEEGFFPSMGSSLLVSTGGGPFVEQIINVDFVLDSQTGVATLTESFGGQVLQGYRGSFLGSGTQFIDPDADFVSAGISEGYQLKIPLGTGEGSYLVQSVVDAITLEVLPAFLENSTLPISWEIYEGYPLSVFDPSLLADVIYEDFTYLSEETFLIRLLTLLGDVPISVPAQTANRLVAEIEKALELGRKLSLRVDPQNRQKEWDLGPAFNGGMFLPNPGTGSYFYDYNLFSLQLGETVFEVFDGLTKVTAFSGPPGSMVANSIEYIGATGELQFSPNLIGRDVTYTEEEVSPTLIGGYDILVTLLEKQELGVIANESLFVPDAGSLRFNDEAFSLQIGSDLFQHGLFFEAVSSFTVPFPADKIEYLSSTGELKFGSDFLFGYSLALVVYVEEFLSPSLMVARTAEINLEGELNLSEDDITQFADQPVYFVEQARTESPDTSTNPIDGSFSFLQPVLSGQIVETEYFQASASGTLCMAPCGTPVAIREVLPVFISGEACTRLSEDLYEFNPSDSTIFLPFTPLVYVGAVQKNRGAQIDYVINYTRNQIDFSEPISDSSTNVTITYARLEATGGETAYSSSTKPIYRPPFYLQKGQNSFELGGNRTSEMVPGKLLRLGSVAFYLKSSTYDATEDITTVEIYPTPRQEAGSRSPGNDLICALSNLPVAVDVVGIPDGNRGFLLDLSLPYQKVQQNQRDITFLGDITSSAVPGHVLQIAGEPFIIASSKLNELATHTTITVTSPFSRQYTYLTHETKISARPIYPENALTFLGPGQIVGEDHEVVLFGETKDSQALPGRTLVSEKHYTIEGGTGNLVFLTPLQEGIQPGQSIYLRYLKTRVLAPILSGGTVFYPRFQTFFTYVQIHKGTSGKVLLGTYSYYNPDIFFSEALSLSDYAAQVALEEAQKAQNQSPGGGSFVVSQEGTGGDKGGTDLTSKVRTVLDKDRVGRLYLDFYNQVIVAFEQIYEGIVGFIIGDREGKFRFFVGRFKDVPPPGYEDPVTGYLNPRSLWSEVFRSHTVSSFFPLITTLEDDIVNPSTAVLSGGELTGTFLDPEDLSDLLEEQRTLVKNDIDDLALLRTGSIKTSFARGVFPPELRYSAVGIHKRMALPHAWSRLYPLRTFIFTTTYPGLGADVTPPGVYAYSYTYINSAGEIVTASTYNKPIAQLGNPVLGDLTKVQKTAIGYRLPRARVWDYRPEGFPEIDPSTAGIPCIAASMVPLSEFPVTPEGIPDTQFLMSVFPGGDKYDLSSGDSDLHIPPFESITDFGGDLGDFYSTGKPQRLALGKPDGRIFNLVCTQESFGLLGEKILSPVFVQDVLQGCLITMRTPSGPIHRVTGAPGITDPNTILKTTEDPLRGEQIEFERGDTIFVIADEPFEISPTEEVNPESPGVFRVGTDVGLNSETGELLDISPPNLFGIVNTSPVTELLSSNPPLPLRTIEGSIEYQNTRLGPVEIPALLGQDKNDSGDYSIPFIGSDLQEPKILKEIFDAFVELRSDSPSPISIYPEEFLAHDGLVLNAVSGFLDPGVLISQENVLPVTISPPYIPYSGIADLRPYDFLFVQTDFPEGGHQGLLSVGDVSYDPALGSWIDPPRFVTQTRKTDRVRYQFDNCMVHLGPAGFITITESGGATRITIDPIVGLTFDDGFNLGLGGLNALVAPFPPPVPPGLPNENQIKIRFFDTGTGILQEQITITGDPLNTLGNPSPYWIAQTQVFPGIYAFPSTAQFFSQEIVIPLIGWVNPGLLGVPFHFSVSVGTQDVASTLSGTDIYLGSFRAYVSENRVTFNDSFDMDKAAPEGTQTIGAVSVQSELSIMTVTDWSSGQLEINSPAVINGGLPFTFLETSSGLGTFSSASGPGVGDENGTIKVTSFRGYGNLSLSLSDITFSGIPSSDEDKNGSILSGYGNADSSDDMKISSIGVFSGAVENVVQGDILVIKRGSDGTPTPAIPSAISKAGTYLVRKAVEDPGPGYKEIVTTASAGGGGWVEISFPKLISFNQTFHELVVSSLNPFPDPTPGVDSPTGHAFPATGSIYVITRQSNITETLQADYDLTCVSAAYIGIDIPGKRFLLTGPGFYWDAGGNVITAADFALATSPGMSISGMVYFSVNLGGQYDQPEVGLDALAHPYGMFQTEYGTDNNPGLAFSFEPFPSATNDIFPVTEKTPVPFNIFDIDPSAPYFRNIPKRVDLTNLQPVTWDSLHNPGALTTLVECILPGETLELTFRAESGIFLEPSVPRPVFDLGSGTPHVVDSTHSLTPGEMGFRGAVEYPSITEPEMVEIEVRRIRRFHEPIQRISQGFDSLRYLNQVRTGIIDGYFATSTQYGLVSSTLGTNLGPFDDEKVNIKAGDLFRLLDADGSLLEELEISGVLGSSEIMLNPPGLQSSSPIGSRFEIYLRKAPVPYGQSIEQLLDLATEETLLRRVADLGTNSGGYVNTVNELRDSEIVLPQSFRTFGVQVGDIIVVDPSGELIPSPREMGTRPLGDVSVPSRIAAYVPGGPSSLDDNRGFYRIIQVSDESLAVTGSSSFAGDQLSGDIIFWSGTGNDYVLYPTISDSPLTGGTEGQNDLRPTAYENGGTFTGDPESIAPFSYRILRPRQLLSAEALDLLLMERDRMLSWIELLAEAVQELGGTYFIFQLETQIENLSFGTLLNQQLDELGGILQVSPFANNASCLSILDRRFWIGDVDLDFTNPSGSLIPYTDFRSGVGRPVLPDQIQLVLDFRDHLREKRMSWIRFRTLLIEGTLAEIEREYQRLESTESLILQYRSFKGDLA